VDFLIPMDVGPTGGRNGWQGCPGIASSDSCGNTTTRWRHYRLRFFGGLGGCGDRQFPIPTVSSGFEGTSDNTLEHFTSGALR
jgi:hypothetical protein